MPAMSPAANVVNPIGTVQVPPSAQLCPFTVVALLANAEFGIALAATAMLGVVVGFVTVGVSHAGHVPAATFVTVPDPPPPPEERSRFRPRAGTSSLPPLHPDRARFPAHALFRSARTAATSPRLPSLS